MFVISVILLVLIFPKEGKFKYEFQKSRPWLHEDLIAPFDFALIKSDEEIEREKEEVMLNVKPYYAIDESIYLKQFNRIKEEFEKVWNEKYSDEATYKNEKEINKDLCFRLFDTIFKQGIIDLSRQDINQQEDNSIIILRDNVAKEIELDSIFTINTALKFVNNQLENKNDIDKDLLLSIVVNSIVCNIIYDIETTAKEKETILSNISLTRGMVQIGQKVISKGELVTNEKYKVLESFKAEYEAKLGSSSQYYLILLGQIVLISISIIVLILFLISFKKDIFANNKKLIMILLLIIIMVFITSLTVKYNVDFLFLVPLCIVPIIIRAFFDSRLALFVHLVTIIIIGFLVPNSFEYLFLQLIAGIIAIISVLSLEKRAQFFLTSVLIFITYSAIYLGLSLIQEGSFDGIDVVYFALFAGSAILTLFSYPVIYIFEKLFGFITDVSLMELSHTKSKLLRELAMRIPGTFQHSMQVANLAEEAIYEIGGNALLVRTGALFHDIGKIDMPMYFIENQTTDFNPHDELNYEESAKMIISHIIKGVEKAKKHKLPEEVIDFIRTHHGTRKAEYFYAKQKQEFPDDLINEELFTYKGPIPFSKETSVVMIADSVEAASRSLKHHDEEIINNLVENIINKQVDSGQFMNSDITFRDISMIKKILKKKLMNIYHVRIEYPES